MADEKKRVVQESFRKRRNNFLRRAHEIGAQYGANIYVLIHRQGKYYVYTSTLRTSWPPPVEEVVIYFLTRLHIKLTIRMVASSFASPEDFIRLQPWHG